MKWLVWAAAVLIVPLLSGTDVLACRRLADAPHSRWRVETRAGVSWLVTPCGDRFFSIGVNVLNGGGPPVAERAGYFWQLFYPDLAAWARSTYARLGAWGFNTAGAWSLHPDLLRLPTIPDLELGRNSRFHWFDPFHPAMEERMTSWARRLVAPYRGNRHRIGYFSDNEVGWWNGALFIYYMKHDESSHTKRRLVSLLREHYADDWARFTRDFFPPPGVGSFDGLLRRTAVAPRLRPASEGIQVIRRWTGLVAAHYYRLVQRTLREADPDALVFADRLPIYYDPVAVRAMAPHVDVVATNYNVDSSDGWLARYYFDGLRQLTGDRPILISEWFFAAHENRTGNRNNGHLMTVQTQSERARGAAASARRFAGNPRIVGMHWFQYHDHPRGGRGDGEDYNFGLVDVHDKPYEELIDALRGVHRRVGQLHASARLSSPSKDYTVPAAVIDPRDRSLADWPKERALVPPLISPPPEVAFGDVYLAWSQAGFSLATISMDYYDPHLLTFEGEFPVEEAFRVEWGIDAGAGPHRFALYIVPPREFPANAAPMFEARLCRRDGSACAPVPGAIATYFGSDQPRITAEAFLPWTALGVDGPPPTGRLRLELTATAFHRSRWMTLSGLAATDGLAHPARWRVLRLADSPSAFPERRDGQAEP